MENPNLPPTPSIEASENSHDDGSWPISLHDLLLIKMVKDYPGLTAAEAEELLEAFGG
jgi:hypothetical protein